MHGRRIGVCAVAGRQTSVWLWYAWGTQRMYCGKIEGAQCYILVAAHLPTFQPPSLSDLLIRVAVIVRLALDVASALL